MIRFNFIYLLGTMESRHSITQTATQMEEAPAP